MKNKKEDEIEKLVSKMMSEIAAEKPSIDFTAKVMADVSSVENRKTLVYQSLISKKGWVFIFASVVALFAFLLLNTKNEASTINFDFSIFNFDKMLSSFSGSHISSSTIDVLLAAAIMLFIQIFLLKTYLNKRFEK